MSADKPSADAPFDPAAVPIRAAATVMLVRDHPINGLEVFMLQRTLAAVFAKGMYVFPVVGWTHMTTRTNWKQFAMA